MRYMFIVFAEGRGHLTQAITLSDILRRNGHQVLEVLVGKAQERDIPTFFKEKIGSPISPFPTIWFKYNDSKEIDLLNSFACNLTLKQLFTYKRSIEFINKRIKANKPDMVICFNESLSSFARIRYRMKVPFVCIGHTILLHHPDYKFGTGKKWALRVLRFYIAFNSFLADKQIALSFYPMKKYSKKKISVLPPLLRKEVREATPSAEEHILVYMANTGYEKEVREWHKRNPSVQLYCFWDKKGAAKELKIDDTLTFFTLDDEKFINYMSSCKGYISTAGFESICEAFYLNKPVMMIPVHVEQEVNAEDASSTGYSISSDKFDLDQLMNHINNCQNVDDSFRNWVDSAEQMFLKELSV